MSLRDLQIVELNVLKEIIKICERHNLTYFALGGTLLGAIRHKGFIPWDDDIDIGMPRPDYEKFLKIAPLALKDPYMLTGIQYDNAEYYYYYVRVIDKNTKLVRRVSMKDVNINAWVDVFPLDGVPEKSKAFDKWYKKANSLNRLFQFSQYEYYYKFYDLKGQSPIRYLTSGIKHIIKFTKVYKLMNTKAMWEKLDNHLKECDYYRSTRLFNTCGAWGVKEMFPKEYYGKGNLYKFEDIMIRGPIDYHAVLTQMYGDYMTPPQDKDKEHHYIEIV